MLDGKTPVALKIIKAESWQNFDEKFQQVSNFLKEIKLLRYVNHDNFVKFYGVSIKDKLAIVTEFIDGDTLDHLIRSGLSV